MRAASKQAAARRAGPQSERARQGSGGPPERSDPSPGRVLVTTMSPNWAVR